MPALTQVFVGCSLDGFIAGEGDDLSFLSGGEGEPPGDPNEYGYTDFISKVGALLMGRRTYDVVEAFDAWPYGETPVLVATHRPLSPKVPTVQAVAGDLPFMIQRAKQAAQGKNVYLDGGGLIRQALDQGLVDELIVTFVPVILGRGVPLFATVERRHRLHLVSNRSLARGAVQLTYRLGAVQA